MKKNKKGKVPYHIKNGYKRFSSSHGYKFWAKDKKDADLYCDQMNWVIGDLDEAKEDLQ